jgi:hypothetical protein
VFCAVGGESLHNVDVNLVLKVLGVSPRALCFEEIRRLRVYTF